MRALGYLMMRWSLGRGIDREDIQKWRVGLLSKVIISSLTKGGLQPTRQPLRLTRQVFLLAGYLRFLKILERAQLGPQN